MAGMQSPGEPEYTVNGSTRSGIAADRIGPEFAQAASSQQGPDQADAAAQQATAMTQHAPTAPAPMGVASYQPKGVQSRDALAAATSGYTSQEVKQANIDAQTKAELRDQWALANGSENAQNHQENAQSREQVRSEIQGSEPPGQVLEHDRGNSQAV